MATQRFGEILSSRLDNQATTDPTTSDGANNGYAISSIWINTSSNEAFICTDATAGAAVWKSLTAGGGGGGSNEEIRLEADDLVPSLTDGCEVPAPIAYSTNNKRQMAARFVSTGTRYGEFETTLPADYAGGTFTVKFFWLGLTAGSSGADTVRWTCSMSAYGDGDAIDAAWGTGVSVDDALDGSFTANQQRVSAATAAITASGTPAAGEKLKIRVYREPTHANDTYAGIAALLGILVSY